MKRKILSFITALVVILSALPIDLFVAAADGSVVFIDADKGVAVNEISAAEKIQTDVTFIPTQTGKANIITAGYDAVGRMISTPVVDTVDVVAGEEKNLQTSPVSTTGAEEIKVFVWGADSPLAIFSRNGLLESAFSTAGRVQKLNAKAGNAEDNPYIVACDAVVAAGELFEAAAGEEINSKYFSLSAQPVGDSTAAVEFVPDTADWTKGTIKFNNTGLIKLIAQDYDFCIPTEIYINVVEPIDRYIAKFDNTEEFLYRVGNLNAVSLSSLFSADGSELPISGVQVTVDNMQGDATGTYTANDDWTKGTIQFSGTGVVSVTIQDDYSNPAALTLEVVDAKNITTAENAASDSVVLLNDISGTFTVSNGHTFYGNGFTVTLPTSSVQTVGSGFTGYISIGAAQDSGTANGGNLDNVRIEGPVYPEMYIYRDQAKITDSSDADYGDGSNMRYFKNSVIVYGGNCIISNSYISGSRTALCLRGGNNVVIENTTLSGGSYANMQVCAGSSVTLRDLTTVQTDVLDSYGQSKTMHGLGIAVDSNVVDVYIEGELKQYNWLCEEQWDAIVPSNYQSSFPDFFTSSTFSNYWHYLNGGTEPYVNMAFIYACNWDTSKIHDNRTTVNYGACDSTIAGVSGGVYSKVNTVGGNAITDADLAAPSYTSPGFNPVAPVLNFDNTANNDDDDASNSGDTYCVYDESNGILKLGITEASKVVDLSDVTVTKNGIPLTFTKYLNGTEISGSSVEIKSADGTKQTLTFKATTTDCGYDKDGNPVEGSIDYTWTVTVEVATLAFPAPEWNMGGNYTIDATTNCVYATYSNWGDKDYGEAVPIYEGIKINYYNKSGTLVALDLSGTTTVPSGSENSNSNAFTYTLSDGSTLEMKYSSGWKSGATTHQFTTYNNKVYVYPQSLDNSNYVLDEIEAFDVKINYTFTDPNGQSITQQMTWSGTPSTTVQWYTFDSKNGKSDSGCVTGDTLVTLADGSQKRIDAVTYDDEILVWDFYEGAYTTAPVSLLINHGYDTYEIIGVTFDDGTEIDIVGSHGIFNKTLNEFVDIDSSNVSSFVGNTFIKATENDFKEVKLISYEIRNEYNSSYTILSSNYHNAVLNGMLTISPSLYAENLYEPFEVGEDMKYDAEKMQKDIETYGLYTYEEFAQYLTREQFDVWGIANMKVTVGKGYTTYDTIVMMLKAFAIPNA